MVKTIELVKMVNSEIQVELDYLVTGSGYELVFSDKLTMRGDLA